MFLIQIQANSNKTLLVNLKQIKICRLEKKLPIHAKNSDYLNFSSQVLLVALTIAIYIQILYIIDTDYANAF